MAGPYSFDADISTGDTSPTPAAWASGVAAALNEAASAATPSVLVLRDAAGRAKFADPSADADAATKGWVTTQTGLLVPKSLVDAKGDLIVATGNDTVSRLPVGSNGQVLTADSAQASGVKWATPSGGGGGSFPTSPYYPVGRSWPGMPFSGEASNQAVVKNQMVGQLCYVQTGMTLTSASISVQSASTSGGLGRIAVYSAPADGGTLTLVADLGTVAIDTTGKKEISSLSVDMPVGAYMVTLWASEAATFRAKQILAAPFGMQSGGNEWEEASWRRVNTMARGTIAFGSAPATLSGSTLGTTDNLTNFLGSTAVTPILLGMVRA